MRFFLLALCMLSAWCGAANADEKSGAYLLNPGDVILVSVWREDDLQLEVRVLPDDAGSSEGNPPSYSDFITRDLRWAAGNMQYLALLRLPGLTPMARWQLIQAILLFLSAPFYVAILLLAAWLRWGA